MRIETGRLRLREMTEADFHAFLRICAVRDWTFRNLPFGEIYSYMNQANEPSSAAARSYGCHWQRIIWMKTAP